MLEGFRAETSWEVDIFGKLQNAKKAAAANVEEKAAYVQAVQVELGTAVADDRGRKCALCLIRAL